MIDLTGKKGLVVGIANESSVAYGCARAFRKCGADLAITYLNAKAEKYVRPLAEELDAELILPMNVMEDGQMEAVFKACEEKWGHLDFVLHSIAFAPMEDLHGRLVDSSSAGFQMAMDVSCHSFIRMAKLAEPLMEKVGGGCMLTVSYYGAVKVVEHYNMMGPVKAALESCTRYMANELGEKNIRVNALSPGPLKTRAASGISHFEELMQHAREKAPQHTLVDIDDCGALAAFYVSNAAKHITGNVGFVDAGYHVIG